MALNWEKLTFHTCTADPAHQLKCPVSFNILVQTPQTELRVLEPKTLMSCFEPFPHHICMDQTGSQWQIIKINRPAFWPAACSQRPKHFILPPIPWDKQVLPSGPPSPQHSLTLTGQHRCRNFYFITLRWQDLVLTMSQNWSPSQTCSFHSFEDITQILTLIPLFVWHGWEHANNWILNAWNKEPRAEQQAHLGVAWLGKRSQTPKDLLRLLSPVSVQVPAQHIQTRTGKE